MRRTILPHEQVQVLNVNNGERSDTVRDPGTAGSGVVCLNGPAARLAHVGDLVIILTIRVDGAEELERHTPRVVMVDDRNHIRSAEPVRRAEGAAMRLRVPNMTAWIVPPSPRSFSRPDAPSGRGEGRGAPRDRRPDLEGPSTDHGAGDRAGDRARRREARGAGHPTRHARGGLDTSMRDIIKRILVSEVPIVVYVAPREAARRARARSSRSRPRRAMSPGTSIGAATR